jgi:acyl carrier protein
MNARLNRVFQQAFGVSEVNDSMSFLNVTGWDSMAHVALMLALEREFGVSISPVAALDLTDVAAIRRFLIERGISEQ